MTNEQKQLMRISADVTKGFAYVLFTQGIYESTLEFLEDELEAIQDAANTLETAIQYLESAQSETRRIAEAGGWSIGAGVVEMIPASVINSNVVILHHLLYAQFIHEDASIRCVFSAWVELTRVIEYLKPIAEDADKLKSFITELIA